MSDTPLKPKPLETEISNKCFNSYKPILIKYLQNQDENVSEFDKNYMKKCGFKNFENDVQLYRKLLLGNPGLERLVLGGMPSTSTGGRKSRKRSDKIKKRKRRTHTR